MDSPDSPNALIIAAVLTVWINSHVSFAIDGSYGYGPVALTALPWEIYKSKAQ
jgi:hypothetical protein